MTTTYTYSTAIQYAIENLENAEAVAVLTRLKESIDKRNARKSNSPDKKTSVNQGLRVQILTFLKEQSEPKSLDEIAKGIGLTATTHKMTGLMTPLVKSGEVIRNTEGKQTRYAYDWNSKSEEDEESEEEEA